MQTQSIMKQRLSRNKMLQKVNQGRSRQSVPTEVSIMFRFKCYPAGSWFQDASTGLKEGAAKRRAVTWALHLRKQVTRRSTPYPQSHSALTSTSVTSSPEHSFTLR